MKMSTGGLLVDGLNQILLIQRNDSRTWAMPGGAMEAGELPPDAVAREVREETGLIVMPVRLVALHYLSNNAEPFLGFTFRCIQRGGQLAPSDETPQVGFVKASELPNWMSEIHRQRLEIGLYHKGGPPVWFVQQPSWRARLAWFGLRRIVYPWMDWQHKRRGQPPYVPPPSWQTSAFTVIRNEAGAVLWVQRRDQQVWNLPGGMGQNEEPPWETAVRETFEETGLQVTLTDLTGVYVYQDAQPHMVFTFTAQVNEGQLTPGPEAAKFAYFAPGEEKHPLVEQHLQRVADAVSPAAQTQFRFQVGPHLVIKE
ncbi:MAG: NUDIX domain-containing protein [Anaerolineales bacterium]|nr:NUDIX domain-containing protein [Anaerolineales bacterium]